MITDEKLKELQQTAAERLHFWQHGGTSYTCDLYSLMAKADSRNFSILMRAYPVEAATYMLWRCSPSPEEFYTAYGLNTNSPPCSCPVDHAAGATQKLDPGQERTDE